MKLITLLTIILSLGLTGCSSSLKKENYTQNNKSWPRRILVRLTTYSKTERKCDKWTKRGQSSTGYKLKEGFAAVDPNVIPYFSNIFIPEIHLKLEAFDTGSAVVRRTASKKMGYNLPVVDIFFNLEKDAMKFRLNNPQIVEALIFN